jgi:NAD(P)-dependent dehydrogenase (short-subunit alcohol dehydrogenase family)
VARGIGLATATALHRAGARVAIGDLDGDLTASAATGVGPVARYLTGMKLALPGMLSAVTATS